MDKITELHNKLTKETVRLTGSRDEVNNVATEFIFTGVDDTILLIELKRNKKSFSIKLPDALQSEPIFIETSKVLALMEASENFDEFKKLHEKYVENNKEDKQEEEPAKELTDFDKILKGLLSVPKPKDKKD